MPYIPTTQLAQAGGDAIDLFDSTLGADTASFDISGISTAAVNRVTILPSSGNWLAGSRLTLYGLR